MLPEILVLVEGSEKAPGARERVAEEGGGVALVTVVCGQHICVYPAIIVQDAVRVISEQQIEGLGAAFSMIRKETV